MATQAIDGQPAPVPFIGLIPQLRQWLLKANALQLPEKIGHFFIRWIIGYRSPDEVLKLERRKLNELEVKQERDKWFADGERFATEIRNTYTRYGVCYRYKKSEKSTLESIQEVEFIRPFQVTKEVVKIKVDTRHLPRNMGIHNLENPDITRLLSINCEQPVTTYYEDGCGYWIWIEREEGAGGMPRHVSLKDFEPIQEIDRVPSDDGKSFKDYIPKYPRPAHLVGERLAFPLGIGQNHKAIWRTVPEAGNLLIAGSPDAGKSNMANAIICCLLDHNTPKQLKLLLVDLKGGLEFSFYSGLTDYLLKIPKPKIKRHKEADEEAETPKPDREATDEPAEEEAMEAIPEEATIEQDDIEYTAERIPAFIERREFVPGALVSLIDEAERRMEVLKNAECKKIQQYNQKMAISGNMMPYVVAFIDEWADVKLDRQLGAKCEDMLINITNRARATGIYVYLATQSPNKDVLSIRVKNAMNSRMIFRCADQYMSQGLVGNYDAATIPISVKGRGFWVSGSDRIELQTPYIANERVEAIVAKVSGGKVNEIISSNHHDVQEREILEWAVKENELCLGSREIHRKFKSRGFLQDDAQAFAKERSGKTFEIEVDGARARYILDPATPLKLGRGRLPYRLRKID